MVSNIFKILMFFRYENQTGGVVQWSHTKAKKEAYICNWELEKGESAGLFGQSVKPKWWALFQWRTSSQTIEEQVRTDTWTSTSQIRVQVSYMNEDTSMAGPGESSRLDGCPSSCCTFLWESGRSKLLVSLSIKTEARNSQLHLKLTTSQDFHLHMLWY